MGHTIGRGQKAKIGELALFDRVEDGVDVVLLADGNGFELLRPRGRQLLAHDRRDEKSDEEREPDERRHHLVAHAEGVPAQACPLHPGQQYASALDGWDSLRRFLNQ